VFHSEKCKGLLSRERPSDFQGVSSEFKRFHAPRADGESHPCVMLGWGHRSVDAIPLMQFTGGALDQF